MYYRSMCELIDASTLVRIAQLEISQDVLVHPPQEDICTSVTMPLVKRQASSYQPIFKKHPIQATIEEENLPDYDAADYFPVDVGQVFNARYKVLSKLGFGNNSTVWLSRDLQQVYFCTQGAWLISADKTRTPL
jgi:hypothetical protein